MVEISGSAVLVLERSCAWGVVDGAEGPLIDGVVEVAIADIASQDGPFPPEATVNGDVPA